MSTTERLFLQLQVTAATSLPPSPGDQFTIPLSDLLFLNSQGHIAEFESTPGTVTIVGAMAVPEPASIGMLCVGALGLAATSAALRRRRE